MKKLLLLLLLLPLFGSAQIVNLLSPTGDGGFETGTTFALNGWTTVTSVTTGTRTWQVGGAGVPYAGARCAYVGSAAAANGIANATTHHFYRDVAIPAGATNIILSFYYKQLVIDNTYDYMYVNTTTTAFTPVAGTVPAAGYTNYFTNTATVYSAFTLKSYTLPSSLAGTTVRIVFSWKSDGAAPHVNPVIDNINLQYGNSTTPPSCVSLVSPANGATGVGTASQNLTWTTDALATGYDVYFGTSATPPLVSSNQPTTTYATGALTPGTTYYWKIIPRNLAGSATGCSTWSFTTIFPPSNDACSGATSLPCGTSSLAGTTVGTVSEVAPLGYSSNYGVWYKFTGDGLSTTISSLAGAGFDHEMTIMTGVSCGSYVIVSSQDVGFAGGTETYTFTTTLGTQYYIYIAYYATTGTSANTGTFTISRTCPPINDACSSAIAITSLPYTSPVASTVLATSDVPTSASTCAAQGMNIWYSVVGNNTNYSATTCNASTNFDTDVRVLTGACSALNSMTDVGCNDDDGVCASSTLRSTVSWCAEFGITYYISVGGFASTSGDVRLTVSSTGVACSVLPIELLSFDAYMVDTTVNIKWSTATETNCDYFLVERSIDGIDWKEIAHVNGNGTSAIVHHYKTTDPTASFGYNYYRLREVDYNGQFEIFPIKSVYKPDKIKEVYMYINTLGQQIDDLNNYSGLYLIMYNDGSIEKRVKN